MTYLEKYKQLHPEEDVTDVPLNDCPDSAIRDITGFRCPARPGVDGPGVCYDCWDSKIPGTEATPPKSEPEAESVPTPEKAEDGKVTARILVESDGDTIHMEADGDMEDLVLSVLAAVHGVAKDVFDSVESKLAAEKIIYGFQLALNPLAKARSLNHE